MSPFRTGALVALALVIATAPLAAQADRARQGFWFGAGVGPGYADLYCGICGGEAGTTGTSAHLRAGGTLTRAFLLGAEASGWFGSDGDLSRRMALVTATGTWYPKPEHGLFVKFGVGMSLFRASEDDEALTASLFTGQVGAGYEMLVNPRVSLAPFLQLAASANGDLMLERTANGGLSSNRVAQDAQVVMLQFGMAVTRH